MDFHNINVNGNEIVNYLKYLVTWTCKSYGLTSMLFYALYTGSRHLDNDLENLASPGMELLE